MIVVGPCIQLHVGEGGPSLRGRRNRGRGGETTPATQAREGPIAGYYTTKAV